MKRLLILLMALAVSTAGAQLKKSYVKYADSTRIADSSRAGGVNDSAANVAGTGVGIYKTETSNKMLFKRLKAGTGITISDSTDSVMIVGTDTTALSNRINAKPDSSTVLYWADTTLANGIATDYDVGLRLLKTDTVSLSNRILARADSSTALYWADTTLANGVATNYDVGLRLLKTEVADSLDSAQTIQRAWKFINGIIWGDATTQNSKGIPWGSPANRETPVYDTAAAVYILETTPVNVTTATYYPRMSTDGDTVMDGSLHDSSGTTIATGPWEFQDTIRTTIIADTAKFVGPVGIGTTTPTSLLTLGNFTGSHQAITIQSANNMKAELKLFEANSSYGFNISHSGVTPAGLSFFRLNGAGEQLTMFIDRTANRVGIATPTPDSTLTVIGSIRASSNVKVDGNLTVVSGLRAIYSWTIDSTALALYGTSFNRTWFKTDADSVKVDSLCAVSYGRASGDTVSVRVLWGASRDTPSDSLSDLKCYHAAGGVAAVSTKVIPPNQFVWVKITEEDGAAKEIQFEIKGKRKP